VLLKGYEKYSILIVFLIKFRLNVVFKCLKFKVLIQNMVLKKSLKP